VASLAPWRLLALACGWLPTVPAAAVPLCLEASPRCAYLRSLEAQGMAAGNAGDYYQNADGDHAPYVASRELPGVTVLPSSRGVVTAADPTRVIVGNASLVYQHPSGPVSLNRLTLMTSQVGALTAYRQYVANNAFWYPAHADYGTVDLFHAMLPQPGNSVGASGSEVDEVSRSFWTLAAFRPATKALLKQHGLLMPTLQMIHRRSRVQTNEECLSGKAHPNAFDDHDGWLPMMRLANGILPEHVPPMVQLRWIDDTFSGEPGIDVFDADFTQRLFDVRVSIARLWRNHRFTNTIRVHARDSFDVNQRPLTFHWKVLRGEDGKVRILPRNPEQSEVDIEMDYHPERVVNVQPNGARLMGTSLIVVGAFVHNGVHYSAPGFVTAYTLPMERRVYNARTRQLTEVTYEDHSVLVARSRVWQRDVFHHDAHGQRTGWTRTRDGRTFEFTREGYQVVRADEAGRPVEAQRVRYETVNGRVDWVLTGLPFPYCPEPSA